MSEERPETSKASKKASKTDPNSFLDFLNKKTEKEMELREREIALRERQIEQDEKDREHQRNQQVQMLKLMEAFASRINPN